MRDKQRQGDSNHAPGSVRHAEKRRTGTCRFADRVAQVSLDAYQSCVSLSFREHQKQTCVATVVAHFASDGHLQVMGLGVGTKFLTEALLRAEADIGFDDGAAVRREYGLRVRDCHAEVLARRAFRRQLSLEMQRLLHGVTIESTFGSFRLILRQSSNGDGFDLVDGVTLHFYTSSAPCGNATLKKFAKMGKETFVGELESNEWPQSSHEPVRAHSLRLGQFALLVKKDSTTVTEKPTAEPRSPTGERAWPVNQNDDWCPPGTSIVSFQNGSLHTCSDKICRWNCLGLQGSLLASMLTNPLYMSTITVGRKLTACICRRAVCCRADGFGQDAERGPFRKKYSLHHPAVMGTGVYMDDNGKE